MSKIAFKPVMKYVYHRKGKYRRAAVKGGGPAANQECWYRIVHAEKPSFSLMPPMSPRNEKPLMLDMMVLSSKQASKQASQDGDE